MQRTVHTIDYSQLEPLFPEHARTMAVQVGASQEIARGDRLGQITATKKYVKCDRSVLAVPAAAPSLTAAGSDGTLATGVRKAVATYVDPNGGETTASAVGSVTVGSTNHVAVAGITLPDGVDYARIYWTDAAGDDYHLIKDNWDGTGFSILVDAASLIEPPTVNTAFEVSDGSQIPRVIAKNDFESDSSGNVFIGTDPVLTGPGADPQPTAMVYWVGDFPTSALADIDAAEAAALGGKLMSTGDAEWLHLP